MPYGYYYRYLVVLEKSSVLNLIQVYFKNSFSIIKNLKMKKMKILHLMKKANIIQINLLLFSDETPENCRDFLDCGGMAMFVKSLELHPSALELHRNMIGLMVKTFIDFLLL